MKRLNVKFETPDQQTLYLRFKSLCSLRDLEMSELVREWVKRYVEESRKQKAAKKK